MKFPDPVIDIRDATSWVVDHIDEVNADADAKADIDNIFVMGHSAGAAIVASLLLMPNVLSEEVKPRIRGAILKGAVYHFNTKVVDLPPPVISAYYGSPEDTKQSVPLSLLNQASDEAVRSLPEIVLVVSEFEAYGVLESHGDFRRTLQERLGKDVLEVVMKGHTHITPHVSLYTGLGEEWAHELIAWMRAKIN